MTEVPYHFTAGKGPILVSMPHVGSEIPQDISGHLTEDAKRSTDTDWYVDQLYDFLEELNYPVIRAINSRYVIDLNRGAEGKALYPGQSETELCPTTGFGGEDLYLAGHLPDSEEVLRRKKLYWQPYHGKIQSELLRIREQYGYAILWDAHSIQNRVPRFFDGQLPDLNIGTGNGTSCIQAIADLVLEKGQRSDYSTVLNGRFKGGYITRHYGKPEDSIHAVQLEISQIAYMDEAPLFEFRQDKAQQLRPTLRQMMTAVERFFS